MPSISKGVAVTPPGARELEIKVRMGSGITIINDLQQLSLIYSQANQFEEAERYCRQALQIAEDHLGRDSEALGPVLRTYARLLEHMNRSVEAKELLHRAEHLSQKHDLVRKPNDETDA